MTFFFNFPTPHWKKNSSLSVRNLCWTGAWNTALQFNGTSICPIWQCNKAWQLLPLQWSVICGQDTDAVSSMCVYVYVHRKCCMYRKALHINMVKKTRKGLFIYHLYTHLHYRCFPSSLCRVYYSVVTRKPSGLHSRPDVCQIIYIPCLFMW